MAAKDTPLDPPFNWALRVLEMVGELHKLGYHTESCGSTAV